MPCCALDYSAAVAIFLEEEEEENRLVAALEVIPRTMLELRKRLRGSPIDDNLLPVKRRIIFWDCQRGESCIQDDYLGPSPRFSLDDFKRRCLESCTIMLETFFVQLIPFLEMVLML